MTAAVYLGLMSGTSMDGVDAAVCEFQDSKLQRIAGTCTRPYAASLRQRLLQVAHEQPALRLDEFCALDAAVADVFAQTALGALKKSGMKPDRVRAIGSHGQTIFHAPGNAPGTSLQIGDPNRIATLTGITTVADFRRRDLALGGQGAPLVPAFHHAQFARAGDPRVIVNIGGIANLTLLPGGTTGIHGFDTGPGNALMDEWISEKQQKPHDAYGAWAGTGKLHAGLLEALLAHPHFSRRPPKSTGRADFNLRWCRSLFAKLDALDPADVQRTFCELTAHSIADAICQSAIKTGRVLLCGGGARNKFLVSRLQALLPAFIVEPTDVHGLDAEWVEAAAFAWLAMRTLNGLPGNLPAVTGASLPTVLGGIYPVKPL